MAYKSTGSEYLLGLEKDFGDFKKSLSGVSSSLKETGKALKESTDIADAFGASLVGAAKTGLNLVSTFAAVASAASSLTIIAGILDGANKAFVQVNSTAATLDFAQVIQGTDELAQNFDVLTKTTSVFSTTANKAFNGIAGGIEQSIGILINRGGYEQWSKQAVGAFKNVETAAYRTSTVIVGAGERSINSLDKTIESMRRLQDATNGALDSVTVLNAQYEIASAGFTDPTANQNVGKAAIDLSQAGFGDLEGSTNALVRVLRALGDSSEDADKRAAQLFQTTKVGLTTIDQLTPEVGSLASLGKQLGLSFGEVSSALAVLTTQGLSTSESATALTNLLLEISSGSEQAQKALAGLSTAAGKPLQLNAQSLKENGLQKIIEDLGNATGGRVESLQNIFSSQESLKGAQLLIGAGSKTFKQTTNQIENADPTDLTEEAANRAKTLEGAFQQASNKSRKYVEELGQGLKSSVIDRLEDTSGVIGTLATSSASAVGDIAGKFDALSGKIKAVGTFLSTAFTTVAPIVLFQVIFANIGKVVAKVKTIFDEFKAGKKDSQSWADYLYQAAIDAISKISVKFEQFIAEVRQRIRTVKDDLDNVANSKKQTKPVGVEKGLPQSDRPEVSGLSTNVAPREEKVTPGPRRQRVDLSKESGFTTVEVNAKRVGTVVADAEKKVSTFGQRLSGLKTQAGNLAKGGFGILTQTIGSTIGTLGPLAVGLGLGAAAFQVTVGWLDTFGKIADSRTIPAVQDLRTNLESLKSVDAFSKIVDELDLTSTKLDQANYYAAVLTESIGRLGGAFNQLTGKTVQNDTFQQIAQTAQNAGQTETNRELDAAKRGTFVADNAEERLVRRKIELGVTLNPDDVKALQDDTDEALKVVQSKIDIQKQRIAETQASGGINRDSEVEALKKELATLEQQATAEQDILKKRQDALVAASKLAEIQNFDTTIPLQVQLTTQSISQSQAQIDDLKKSFGNVFSADNVDPTSFNNLLPQLTSTLDTIKLQAAIDPNSARQSFQQIQGIQGFDKLIFSDVNARNAVADFSKSLTDAISSQAENVKAAATSVFDAVGSIDAGGSGTLLEKNKQEVAAIDTQVAALSDELNSQATPLQRQLEILGQIEQLEGQRVALNAESRVAQETSEKKKVLGIQQQILTVDQARVNLFNQESKFNSLAISAAQARLQAAQQELAVKKQQIDLDTTTERVRKEVGVEALQARRSRIEKAPVAGSSPSTAANAAPKGPGGSPEAEATKAQTDVVTASYTSNTDRLIQTITESSKAQIDAITQSAEQSGNDIKPEFSKTEQDRIIRTFQNNSQARRQLGVNSGDAEQLRKAIFEGNQLNDPDKIKRILADTRTAAEPDKVTQTISFLTAAPPAAQRATIDNARAEQANSLNTVLDKLNEAETRRRDLRREGQTNVETVQQRANNRVDAVRESTSIQGKAEQQRQAQLNSVDEAIKSAIQDQNFGKLTEQLSKSFDTFNEEVNVAAAQIELEYAAREKLIAQSEALGQSFGSLGSVASSLFSSSAVGASLSNVGTQLANPQERALKDASLELAKINSRFSIIQSKYEEAVSALSTARSNGASPEVVRELENQVNKFRTQRDTASSEIGSDTANVRQRTVVEALTGSLQQFQSQVTEVTETMSKQAEVFKDAIDFNLQIQQDRGSNNDSIRGLNEAIFSFFGQNNPYAELLGQRSQVQGIEDNRVLQRTQAVGEAQKQIIDLSVLNAQLELEQRGYDNALTQTQILSDIVASLNGQETRFTGQGSSTEDFIRQIPALFQRNRELTSVRQDLTRQQLNYIPQQLQGRLQNIDRNSTAERLNTLGQNLNPGNVGLIIDAIGDARTQNAQSQRQTIQESSLTDPAFVASVQSLTDTFNSFGNLSQDFRESSREFSESARNQTTSTARQQFDQTSNAGSKGSGNPVNFAPQVNINFQVESGGNTNEANLISNLRGYAQTAVNSGLDKISRQLEAMTR